MYAFVVGWGILPSTALAWSNLGHQTIAIIAQDYLSEDAKAQLKKILNGQAIEKAASWPDAVKQVDDWKHSKYYHYKNLPEGADYFTDLKSLSESKAARGDIVRALLHAEDLIVAPGTNAIDRKNAMRFFIHLIGDLHQPLHVGFVKDVGGNLVKMNWNGVKTNLHAVWDRQILLTYGKKNLLPTEYYTPVDVANSFKDVSTTTLGQWRNGDYVDWLNESIVLRDAAYVNLTATTENYYKTHVKTMELQIHKAGYRLAVILEGLLAKFPTTSKNNSVLRSEILSIIGAKHTDFNTDMELTSMNPFRFYEPIQDEDHDHGDDCN